MPLAFRVACTFSMVFFTAGLTSSSASLTISASSSSPSWFFASSDTSSDSLLTAGGGEGDWTLAFAGDFFGGDFFGDGVFWGVGELLFAALRLLFGTGCTSDSSLSSTSSAFSRFRFLLDSVPFASGVSSFSDLTPDGSAADSGSAPLLALCRFAPKARVVCFFGDCCALPLPPKNRLHNPNVSECQFKVSTSIDAPNC